MTRLCFAYSSQAGQKQFSSFLDGADEIPRAQKRISGSDFSRELCLQVGHTPQYFRHICPVLFGILNSTCSGFHKGGMVS